MWLTNSPIIADKIRHGKDSKVTRDIKKGLIEQLIRDGRIKNESDEWISYVEDDEDWDASGDMAWDDASGKTLDPKEVIRARKKR